MKSRFKSVIGQRYELNDQQVSVIGEIVEPRQVRPGIDKQGGKKMPKLVIRSNTFKNQSGHHVFNTIIMTAIEIV